MSPVDSDLLEEAGKLSPEGAWVWLVTVFISDVQTIHLTDNNESITFDGVLYRPAPVQISAQRVENTGNISEVSVTIGNANLAASTLMNLNEGFGGRSVRLQRVHTDNLANTNASISQTFRVRDASADISTATFRLGLDDIFAARIPYELLSARRCRWSYNSPIRRALGIETLCAYQPQVKDIEDATNTTPIVITTTEEHGFKDGAVVVVAGVGGNTAANGTWIIELVDPDSFVLVGSAGNDAFTSGGTATVDLPTCDRTRLGDNGCLAHDNLLNFGGAPGIPRPV